MAVRDSKRERERGNGGGRIRYLVVCFLTLFVGCATLREAAALRRVDFRYDGVSDAQVARVRLDRLRSYRDLSVVDIGRLTLAVASKDVPLELVAHLEARNPETNQVTARLIALDWTYLVDDREIVSGTLDRALQFPPGQSVDVPVVIRFNLARVVQGDARALFETALALTGHGSEARDVTLRITPTIDTAVGPIRYPVPITVTITPSSAP